MIIPLGINGGDQDNSKVEELMKLMLRFNGVLPGTVEKKNKKGNNNKYFKMYSLTVFLGCHYNISRWSFTNTGICTNITGIVSVR